MAPRLEQARIGTARLWLAMQMACDRSRAAKRKQPRIKRFVMPKAA